MKNSMLIRLLKELSPRELTKFQSYIDSPFFNKRDKVKLLYAQIIRAAPLFKASKLDKRKIFASIFKPETYNELKINNLISDLLQLLYDFLAFMQYQKNQTLQKRLLIKEFLERDIHQHIDRSYTSHKKLQKNTPIRNHEYYYDQYEIHNQMDQFFLTKGIRAYDKHLQEESDALDLSYISNKLRIAVDMTSRNFVSNAGYTCHFLPELIENYEANRQNSQQHPVIDIYYKILQMLRWNQTENGSEKSEYYYQQLKILLSQNLDLFPTGELRVIYLYLQNYCIYKINSGQSKYYQEIFDLYKFLLEKKIIFKNGYLTQWAYKNIVTVGIRIKDFTWTEKMIHQHKANLLPQERDNVVAYNLAAVYYAKKDYRNALQQLHNVEFTDNSFHLGAKIIQLKSYYETDESEAFFALIEAFKKYISRNKEMADYRKKANLNFIKMASQIYTLKLKKSFYSPTIFHKKQLDIEQKIKILAVVANKEWLVEIFARLQE